MTSPLRRSCGPCYVCCVGLGIDELKKRANQSCRHLTGENGPEKRCGIYAERPHACVQYSCGWRDGLGNDDERPDKVGFFVTSYEGEEKGQLRATIAITDPALAALLAASISDITSPLNRAVTQLLDLGFDEIKIIHYKTRTGLYFVNGEVYFVKVHPQEAYEDLSIEPIGPPIGRYMTVKLEPE